MVMPVYSVLPCFVFEPRRPSEAVGLWSRPAVRWSSGSYQFAVKSQSSFTVSGSEKGRYTGTQASAIE